MFIKIEDVYVESYDYEGSGRQDKIRMQDYSGMSVRMIGKDG